MSNKHTIPFFKTRLALSKSAHEVGFPTTHGLLIVSFFAMFASLLVWQASFTSPQAVQHQGVVLGEADEAVAPDAWWDSDWKYRMRLGVDATAITQELYDVPVLVTLNTDRFNYATSTSDGSDIRFVYSTSTALSHEIETWNTEGESRIWVSIPVVISATSTDAFWMYYGYTGNEILEVPTEEEAYAVWTNGFEMVHHLNESSGQHRDSTAQGHHATNQGSVQDSLGTIDGANAFDGLNDYLDLGGFSVPGEHITLEAWIKADDFGVDTARIISKADSQQAQGHLWALGTMPVVSEGVSVMGTRFMLDAGGRTQTLVNDTVPLEAGVWTYVVATYDEDAMRLYHNGVLAATREQMGGRPAISFKGVAIGNQPPGAGKRAFDGTIDEVRISHTGRSSDWVALQYLSMTDALIMYGAPEQEITELFTLPQEVIMDADET